MQFCNRILKGKSRGIVVLAKSIRKRTFAKASQQANDGLLLGYARVSKGDEQNNALQTKALKAAGCRRLFEEAASGGRWDRPELHRMLDHLREGDTVVVWKLDRLSRSLKDVLHIMERIANAGAGFRSITENIDTTTPAGRMMMQMVASFAEFERAMIRERTSAGLAAARAEGRIGGRRKKLDAGKRKEIADSVISGRKSGAEMARLYNISPPTVSRIVAQHRTGLVRHYTLSAGDLATIRRYRGDHNRLGYAPPAKLRAPSGRKRSKPTVSSIWRNWSWRNAGGAGSSSRHPGASNASASISAFRGGGRSNGGSSAGCRPRSGGSLMR
jgi:DNA invertase Pin-like site-specific DNA recombinase